MQVQFNKYLKGGFYNLDFVTKLAIRTGNTIQYNYDKNDNKFYQIDKRLTKLSVDNSK